MSLQTCIKFERENERFIFISNYNRSYVVYYYIYDNCFCKTFLKQRSNAILSLNPVKGKVKRKNKYSPRNFTNKIERKRHLITLYKRIEYLKVCKRERTFYFYFKSCYKQKRNIYMFLLKIRMPFFHTYIIIILRTHLEREMYYEFVKP